MTDLPLLAARDLRRTSARDGRVLLDGVSLELRGGERLGLSGPSGAGKTVLLRALALLDPLAAGEVRIGGEVPRREAVPRARARIVYAHQKVATFAGDVEENLRRPFALKIHRHRAFDRDRASRWLLEAGRDRDFLQRDAALLSGGEQRLVALLRILLLDPQVVLLDEATSGLDPESAASAERLLEAWRTDRPDTAWIWVGHDAGQSRRMTDRTLTVRHGRLDGEAAPP